MSLDITPLVSTGRQLIEAYGNGGFVIAGTRYIGSVIVLPERTLAWAAVAAVDVTELGLAPLFEAREPAEILIVGCGPRFAPAPGALRPAFKARGVTLEWMDTGAACRTFNVLLAEGRPVAAALIAVA